MEIKLFLPVAVFRKLPLVKDDPKSRKMLEKLVLYIYCGKSYLCQDCLLRPFGSTWLPGLLKAHKSPSFLSVPTLSLELLRL